MRLRWSFLPLCLLVSAALSACKPWDDANKGEFNAGSIDPIDFAPPYRTSNGYTTNQLAAFGNPTTCVRQTEGSCTIQEFAAFIGGTTAGYFRFPFSPSQITTTQYAPVVTTYGTATAPGGPLNVDNFTPLRVPGGVPTPNVYVFDSSFLPGGDSSSCTPPANYTFDAFRDDVRYDRQGNIFQVLPNATWPIGANPTWTYTPVVGVVPVTSQGEKCQGIKSEATLLDHARTDVSVPHGPDRADGSPTGLPGGTYQAWALIDPGAPALKAGDVLGGNPGQTFGFTHHRYGWFNQYLVAYLDGGPITIGGTPPRMQTQRLYYPRSFNGSANCPAPPPATSGTVPCGLGNGWDVMEAARGQPGSSPVCQVLTYPATGSISRSATDITTTYAATIAPPPIGPAGSAVIPPFIFCLQVP